MQVYKMNSLKKYELILEIIMYRNHYIDSN
jgi:hypothetical protein